MKLIEVIQPASQFMTDHDQIEAWLNRYHITNYTIHPNGVVDIIGDVDLTGQGVSLPHLPIQFGRVDHNFFCNGIGLTSLVGCPSWVGGTINCFTNEIESLVGCPSYIGNDLYCDNNNIGSLSGIHKHVKHIGHLFASDDFITNILGLMLIDSLKEVNIQYNINEIMNKHLRGKRDIHACQEELIEAGFGAQAKL